MDEQPETPYRRKARLLGSSDESERMEGLALERNEHLKAIRGGINFLVAVVLLALVCGIVWAIVAASSESSSSGF